MWFTCSRVESPSLLWVNPPGLEWVTSYQSRMSSPFFKGSPPPVFKCFKCSTPPVGRRAAVEISDWFLKEAKKGCKPSPIFDPPIRLTAFVGSLELDTSKTPSRASQWSSVALPCVWGGWQMLSLLLFFSILKRHGPYYPKTSWLGAVHI